MSVQTCITFKYHIIHSLTIKKYKSFKIEITQENLHLVTTCSELKQCNLTIGMMHVNEVKQCNLTKRKCTSLNSSNK